MQPLLDYFLVVANGLIDILNRLSFNDSFSLLYYLLGAIIIGFIIKLIKGGSNEFEHSFNFSTGTIISSTASKYHKKLENRKKQIIEEKNNF